MPEILAPAGDAEKFETALKYGADAVYFSGPELNLRAKSKGLSWEEMSSLLAQARKAGQKGYFCLNLLAKESQLKQVEAYIERIARLSPDGIIIADPGILHLVKKSLPHLSVHLSTQANTSNSQAARFWQSQGVDRVNLARELSLREIRAFRESLPDLELEVFVHGAMCMAISGKCLMSAFLNQRSANQGLCTHPCRFKYRPVALALEEIKRPGRAVWEVYEEKDYSEILASQDLCLVKYLPWLVKNRIQALKIEGRMKTSAYVAQVVDVYKTALQDFFFGRFRPGLYFSELLPTITRPLSSGLFLGSKKKVFLRPEERVDTPVLARIKQRLADDKYLIQVKHKWQTRNRAIILVPGLKRPVLKAQDYLLENQGGEAQKLVHSGQEALLRSENQDLEPGLLLRGQDRN